MTKKKVATEKVDETMETFVVKKGDNSIDKLKTMRKDLNRNFNNLSQIFNYIRKNTNGQVKDILMEEFKDDEQMVKLALLVINAGWLNIFQSWHDMDVDMDEEGNPIQRYKKHPSTPAMFLTRLKMMVRNVYDEVDDGDKVNENTIRRILDLETKS